MNVYSSADVSQCAGDRNIQRKIVAADVLHFVEGSAEFADPKVLDSARAGAIITANVV